ncbi:MAG: hypothetical protein P1V81_17200, partial [Planctomycetota bacterium]|nr:hypothetical protein [Planctomycetota bacterium]
GAHESAALPDLPPLPEGAGRPSVSWYDLGGDEWLVTRMAYLGPGWLEQCWLVGGEVSGAAQLVELPGIRAAAYGSTVPQVEAAARLDTGALILLVTLRFRSTMTHALLCLDPSGELLWRVDSDYRDPSMLFSPDEMTVVGGDLIVVLDAVRDQLQLFGADGKYQRTVDLEQAWGQEPSNPSELRPDRRGGLLVSDFAGEPGSWRMDLEAGTSEPLDVRLEDGGQPEELTRYLRAASDGSLWTTDGFQLLELDDLGAVVRSHDALASPDVVYDPGPPAIRGNGRICLQDQRTGSIHAWSESGERLHIAHLPAELVHAVETWPELVVEPEGGVWAKLDGFELLDLDMDSGPTPDPWVRFDAEGAYVGRMDLQRSASMGTDGERSWWWTYTDGPEVRAADGEPIGRIEQARDGSWIKAVRDVSFAPDGSTWIWERLERPRHGDQPTTGRILVCGPDLEVEEAWTLVMGDEPIGVDAPQHAGPWVLPSVSQPLLLTMPSPGVWKAWDLVGLELADEARLGFSASGEELLLVDADLTLTRFALPSIDGE